MKLIIKRVSLLQAGKVIGMIYAMVSCVWLLVYVAGQLRYPDRTWAPLMMMLLYPFIAAVLGMLAALAYNIAAAIVGGFEITLTRADGEEMNI